MLSTDVTCPALQNMVFPEAPPLSTALAQLGAPQVSQQPLMSALRPESHAGSGGLMAAASAGGPRSLLGSGPGGPLMVSDGPVWCIWVVLLVMHNRVSHGDIVKAVAW